MIFFRAKKLADKLNRDEVPQWQFIIYALVFALFFILPFINSVTILIDYISNSATAKLGGYDLYVLISALIGLITLLIAYKINSAGDNKRFGNRFSCLYFPIFNQVALITIPLFTIAYVITLATSEAIEKIQNYDVYSIPYDNLLEFIDPILLSPAIIASYTIPLFYGVWLYTKSFRIASGQEAYNK